MYIYKQLKRRSCQARRTGWYTDTVTSATRRTRATMLHYDHASSPQNNEAVQCVTIYRSCVVIGRAVQVDRGSLLISSLRWGAGHHFLDKFFIFKVAVNIFMNTSGFDDFFYLFILQPFAQAC